MVNQKFYQLGTAPSVIRELFAYGLEQEIPASLPRPRSTSPSTTFSTTRTPSGSTGTPWPAASTRPGRPLPPI